MEPSAKLTFQYHDNLNPLVWKDGKLIPAIKDKLLQVAEAFLESFELDIDVEDITFTGSLANYNYTPQSDIDLHILTDLTEYGQDVDFLKDYFKAKKTVWNSNHDIKIKGFDVECYVQDINEPHYATGIYSIKNDSWLVIPEKEKPIDQSEVKRKVDHILELISHALSDSCNLECAERVKEKILKMRQAGLEAGGEFSVENLAFKELRRRGMIDKLVTGVVAKGDKELSLNQENFKQFFALPGMSTGGEGSRGPRHQGLTAGISKLTKPNTKSVTMVARSHIDQETPFPAIENLKKKKRGKTHIPPNIANAIASFYSINMDKVHQEPRKLSTSGISLAFDPVYKYYYLSKEGK